MKMLSHIRKEMIGACGVNCLACVAHLNHDTPCPGCHAPKATISRKSCRDCSKRNCAEEKGLAWCFQCDEFPCKNIKYLSKHYEKKHNIDLIQNGHDAKENMPEFLNQQRELFKCHHCGGVVNEHQKICSECGKEISK